MQTNHFDISNRVGASGKRSLDASSSQEGQPERKRPALASVIVEALKVDSLHKLCSSLEPILRKVVSEEVERALAKLGTVKPHERVSPKRINGPDRRNLQLQFRSALSQPIFTGAKVEGEQGTIIHVVLVDASTGYLVTTGPESSVKLDIVVLEGDFNKEDDEGWSQEEFESHIVRERDGRRPLLTGDLQVILREGVGTLGEVTFTDNSSWIRSRKFRLGLKMTSGSRQGIRIREAKTDAFMVRDHRGELYKKHYPPELDDEVWRLEKIGKDGSFHKRLNKAGIHKVVDFLRLSERDPQKLRKILGNGMSNKMWNGLIEHAKTCVLSGKFYVYYPDDSSHIGVIFNNIYALSGLIAGGEYYSVDSLSESQKLTLDSLVKKAYDNWNVIEYDGKSLLGFDLNKFSDAYRNDLTIHPQDQPHLSEILSFPSLSSSAPDDHPTNPGSTFVGYYNSIGGQDVMSSQNMNPNIAVQLGETSFSQPNQLMNSASAVQGHLPSGENILALGPLSNFPSGDPSTVSYMEYESMPLEEIRLRSHDMLQSEDMQHLLHMLSTCGHVNHNLSATVENSYADFSYSSPIINSHVGFDENRTHSSGKAAIGWLKLKAALRWGIFVRKKAAERRAQLVELNDF